MRNRRFICLLGAALLIVLAGCGQKAEDTGAGAGRSEITAEAETDSVTEQPAENAAADAEQVPGEKEEMTGWQSITQDEAKRIMTEEPDCIILDVRTIQEYNDGHIPGAVCIPNETIGKDEVPELPDKDQTILVYCRSGRRSKEASEKLAALGYTGVLEFGGIMEWTGEVETGEAAANKSLQMTIAGRKMPVAWEENGSVEALKELAGEKGFDVSLSPYGGFEQVGPLGSEIECDDAQLTASPGDIMLYSGDQITVFFGSNTWAYTKLGHIDLPEEELRELLEGEGVTLALKTVTESE